jgi:hypothetical protein
LVRRHGVVPCGRGVGVRISFEGCDVQVVREWAAQCHGVDTGLPAQFLQCQGWPHGEGWRNGAGIRFPGGVRGPTWQGFAFDPGARSMSEHLMLRSGKWVRGHEPAEPSSEAEIRPSGRIALERGGDSLEGARSPRARGRFARGGV